jgi:hypothetical protein
MLVGASSTASWERRDGGSWSDGVALQLLGSLLAQTPSSTWRRSSSRWGVCHANSFVGAGVLTVTTSGRVRMATGAMRSLLQSLGSLLAQTPSSGWDFSPRTPNQKPPGASPWGLLVGRGGFEPPLTGPEPAVLPLNDLPDETGWYRGAPNSSRPA